MKKFVVLLICALGACTTGEDDVAGSDEAADYEVDPDDGKGDGVAAVFNMHEVVGDDVFVDSGQMTAAEVQKFFEASPYGNRSWLADYSVNGMSAAQALVKASTQEGIHPLMLLARMQVEATLVSKTAKPTQTRIDKALGCGCPDGRACDAQYKGLYNQLVCGGKFLRRLYDASADGSGQWTKGTTRRTLDPKSVTPRNHATAALYAYTPWVLVGTGGNWLVWNITRKYVRHAEAEGYIAAN
ncbi:MAG: hypothetical protein H0T42_04135 [Deltaproteobacteria bacterium]|nr:hypothetical protein [Deltaproteobacteria bacterium]